MGPKARLIIPVDLYEVKLIENKKSCKNTNIHTLTKELFHWHASFSPQGENYG